MPIILAIESDRRQRDALTAVVRERVGAELILADTTERALEAIGNRVPDLVLVPALLSPTDDAALAAALRVIAAAAHVRTLTIPVLAAHSASEAKSGLFSRWRRGSSPQSSDGCDPALFAEQIVAYLKESAAEREQFAEQEETDRLRAQYQQDDNQTTAASDGFAPDDAIGESPQGTPAYASDEEALDVEPNMPAAAHVGGDAAPIYQPPDVTPAYARAEMPVAQHEAFAPSRNDTYTRADAEIYTPADAPAPMYTPTYSYSEALFGSGDNEAPIFVRDDETQTADSQPPVADAPEVVHAYAAIDVPQFEQPDFSARLRADAIGFVESEGDDVMPLEQALTLDDSEDIDLSGELAELQGEEEASSEELFDGEPIGIYTMPSLTDEPDFEFSRVNFGRTRVDWPATSKAHVDVEPERDADVEIEFDAEAEFEVEAPLQATMEVEPDVHSEAAFAADIIDGDANETAAVVLDADWDPADAEPAPADADPWLASTLTARWTWPALEGTPTDAPAAGFARADSLAAAAETTGVKKPAAAGPRLVPPMPSIVVPRATPAAKLPSLTVPRAATAAAAAPRPAVAAGAKGRPEWSELVASLRKDIERRRTDPPQEKPKAKPSAAEIVAPAPAAAAVPVSAPAPVPAPVMRRPRRAKPIQDEWGFFDPEQCGFAALLAKLDEITEGAEEKEVRQGT